MTKEGMEEADDSAGNPEFSKIYTCTKGCQVMRGKMSDRTAWGHHDPRRDSR